jgi:DNA modification methylase
MLDPTCGSGSSLRAAESLGAKYVLGLEINKDYANLAREALEKSRRLRKAEAMVHT